MCPWSPNLDSQVRLTSASVLKIRNCGGVNWELGALDATKPPLIFSRFLQCVFPLTSDCESPPALVRSCSAFQLGPGGELQPLDADGSEPWGWASWRKQRWDPGTEWPFGKKKKLYSEQNHRTTESQNSRGWKGPLWVTQSNPPAQAGSPRAGCTGPWSGGSWISPEKETPQPPWAACSSAPSPSEGRSSSWCSAGTSCAPVCAHCPLSCRWAPLKRVWPYPPDTQPSDIYKHL